MKKNAADALTAPVNAQPETPPNTRGGTAGLIGTFQRAPFLGN